jgi:hypothetical protein
MSKVDLVLIRQPGGRANRNTGGLITLKLEKAFAIDGRGLHNAKLASARRSIKTENRTRKQRRNSEIRTTSETAEEPY